MVAAQNEAAASVLEDRIYEDINEIMRLLQTRRMVRGLTEVARLASELKRALEGATEES